MLPQGGAYKGRSVRHKCLGKPQANGADAPSSLKETGEAATTAPCECSDRAATPQLCKLNRETQRFRVATHAAQSRMAQIVVLYSTLAHGGNPAVRTRSSSKRY